MASTSQTGIDDLPDELLLRIFSYLTVEEMAWCALTCRRWHGLVTGYTSLWRGKLFISNRSPRECLETRAVMHALPPYLNVNIDPASSFQFHILYPEMDLSVTYLRIVDECPRLRCRHLVTTVDIAGEILTYKSVIDLEALRTLQILSTRRINMWTTRFYGREYVVRLALDECPNLTGLWISGEMLSADCLDSMQAFNRLRTLQIECSGLKRLTFLQACSGMLEVLKLERCWGLPSREFARLRQLQNLRLLQLMDCRVEEADLAAAAEGLGRLQELQLHRSVVVRDLSILRPCGQLRELCLANVLCADVVLKVTQEAQQLHLHNEQLAVHSVRVVVVNMNVDSMQDALPRLAQLGLSSRCLDYLRPLRHCPLLRHLCCDFIRRRNELELLNERAIHVNFGSRV